MLHVTVLLKHWSFRYMSTIAVVVGAGLIAFVARTASSLDWKLVVTTVSVGLSLIYFVQKQKLEEVHLFNGLFEKFNQRYDRLNERLAEIDNVDSEIGLTNEEKAILVDYFNLCGEEYLYYKLGYIYPEVWNAWLRGMQQYYCNKRIRKYWQEELRTNSYYGLTDSILRSGIKCGGRDDKPVAAGGVGNETETGVSSYGPISSVYPRRPEAPILIREVVVVD